MTAHTSQGLASRLGYGLGRGVRFFLMDENVVLRWVKRITLAGLALWLYFSFARELATAAMTVTILVGVVFALGKGSVSGLFVNDAKVDQPDSEFESGSADNNPYSQGNIHSSLFHESTFNWNEKD